MVGEVHLVLVQMCKFTHREEEMDKFQIGKGKVRMRERIVKDSDSRRNVGGQKMQKAN